MPNPVESGVIVAKWINEPKPGKAKFSIKTPENDFYLATPAVAATMQQGGTYNVQYEVNHFNGTTYKTIKYAVPAATPRPTQTTPLAAPRAAQASTQDTSEHIFVCGLLNGFARAGNLLPDPNSKDELVAVAQMLRAAYREIWKAPAPAPQQARPPQQQQMPLPPQGQQHDPEMSDAIPF